MNSTNGQKKASWFSRFPLGALCIALLMFAGPAASETLPPKGMTVTDAYEPGQGPPVGGIGLVRGEVVIMHAERRTTGYRAKKGLLLYQGDALVTRKKSMVAVRLNDGSLISLSAETTLVVDKSIYNPAREERSVFTRLALGMARFIVQKLENFKRSDFEVQTKTSIAGVRGSDFIVKASAHFTEIFTMEDTRLAVSSLAYPDRETILTDFQQTTVAAGALPKDPVGVQQGEIDALKEIFPDPPGPASKTSPSKSKTADGQVVNRSASQSMRNLGHGKDAASTSAPGGAGGSEVTGSVVNQARLKNAANISEGANSTANMGAVEIKESKVGGEIDNQSQADDVTNISEGRETESNVGSIIVE